MSAAFLFTAESRNAKTGPIPVTTSPKQTCAESCALKSVCYAKNHNLGFIWNRLSEVNAGESFKNGNSRVKTISWNDLIDNVTGIADGALWRFNQAGDLPGDGREIDQDKLNELVEANRGKRGFTYSHHDVLGNAWNAEQIRSANENGFTVNLSGNTLEHADKLAALNIAPVVCLLPQDVTGNQTVTTPRGRRVVVCPATYREDVTCKSCGLCQVKDRKTIVGFPAHGASKKAATQIARQ